MYNFQEERKGKVKQEALMLWEQNNNNSSLNR